MKPIGKFLLIMCLMLPVCGWPKPVPTTAATPPPAQRNSQNSKDESIIDAVAEAVPLGKEAIRAIVKPILDTVTITPRQEMEIGDEFYKEIRKKLGAKLDANRADVAYVTAVGNTLTPNVKRKAIKYHFHVVEDNIPNAFAIAGGHVFIYRGLLDKVIENEAQLAEVLGHEISHVDAEHTVDFYKPVVAVSQLPLADITTLIAALASRALGFTYNEVQESQADELGTILAFKAQYEPVEGAAVQRRLSQLKKTGAHDPITGLADALLRSHPPSEKRAVAIEAQSRKLHKQDPNKKTYIGLTNYQRRTPVSSRIYE